MLREEISKWRLSHHNVWENVTGYFDVFRSKEAFKGCHWHNRELWTRPQTVFYSYFMWYGCRHKYWVLLLHLYRLGDYVLRDSLTKFSKFGIFYEKKTVCLVTVVWIGFEAKRSFVFWKQKTEKSEECLPSSHPFDVQKSIDLLQHVKCVSFK